MQRGECSTKCSHHDYCMSRAHLLLTQHCFHRPVPPNLTMSLQGAHVPQSGCWHASHTPQRACRGAFTASFLSIWFTKNCSNTLRTKGVVVACRDRDSDRTADYQIHLSGRGTEECMNAAVLTIMCLCFFSFTLTSLLLAAALLFPSVTPARLMSDRVHGDTSKRSSSGSP